MNATQICGLLDADLVTFIHNVIVVIKIAVPIILVIFGMLDFAKGVMAGKEDEIKKGQQVFIKRIIAAFFVFFVIAIVQLVMGLISKEDNSFWNCADQILNGTAGSKYEPTVIPDYGKTNTDTNDSNNNSGSSNQDGSSGGGPSSKSNSTHQDGPSSKSSSTHQDGSSSAVSSEENNSSNDSSSSGGPSSKPGTTHSGN